MKIKYSTPEKARRAGQYPTFTDITATTIGAFVVPIVLVASHLFGYVGAAIDGYEMGPDYSLKNRFRATYSFNLKDKAVQEYTVISFDDANNVKKEEYFVPCSPVSGARSPVSAWAMTGLLGGLLAGGIFMGRTMNRGVEIQSEYDTKKKKWFYTYNRHKAR